MTDPFVPARPPGPHPSPEELYAAHRRPEAALSEPVLSHAALCASCSEELMRLEAFDEPEPLSADRLEAAWKSFGEPPATRPVPSRTSRASRATASSRRPLLAIAAGLAACVLGLGIWMRQTPTEPAAPPPPVDVVRGGSDSSGGSAEIWAPDGPLAEAPRELVFPAGGEPQSVLVFEGTGAYRWRSEPSSTGRVVFPEEERKKLIPGVKYYWMLPGRGMAAQSFTVTAR